MALVTCASTEEAAQAGGEVGSTKDPMEAILLAPYLRVGCMWLGASPISKTPGKSLPTRLWALGSVPLSQEPRSPAQCLAPRSLSMIDCWTNKFKSVSVCVIGTALKVITARLPGHSFLVSGPLQWWKATLNRTSIAVIYQVVIMCQAAR